MREDVKLLPNVPVGRIIDLEMLGKEARVSKEYIVQAYLILPNGEEAYQDETSVDADSPREALDTARAVFYEAWAKERKPFLIRDAQLKVTSEQAIPEADLRDINSAGVETNTPAKKCGHGYVDRGCDLQQEHDCYTDKRCVKGDEERQAKLQVQNRKLAGKR